MTPYTRPKTSVRLLTHAEFADRARRYRQSLGYSLRFLACATGLDHSTIAQIENGKRKPKTATQAMIAQCLGFSLFTSGTGLPVDRLPPRSKMRA